MNPIKFLRNIFHKKEEEVDFPPEFAVVASTKDAQQYGIFDDMTKEIQHYQGEEFISRPFLKSLMEAMDELRIPTHNLEKEQIKIPIVKKIYPEDVSYED